MTQKSIIEFFQASRAGITVEELKKLKNCLEDYHLVHMTEIFRDPYTSKGGTQYHSRYLWEEIKKITVGKKGSYFKAYRKPIAEFVILEDGIYSFKLD